MRTRKTVSYITVSSFPANVLILFVLLEKNVTSLYVSPCFSPSMYRTPDGMLCSLVSLMFFGYATTWSKVSKIIDWMASLCCDGLILEDIHKDAFSDSIGHLGLCECLLSLQLLCRPRFRALGSSVIRVLPFYHPMHLVPLIRNLE